MKDLFQNLGWLILFGLLAGCKRPDPIIEPPFTIDLSTSVQPVNIHEKGFEFLDHMQGFWTGSNRVITFDYPWFAFDYRAISPSHVFGIHEGGSMGNLLTSFFVTDYMETRTLMARNGGVLNGIYRTTYFVLDSVRNDAAGDYYRFVDAKAGPMLMYMDLLFKGDSLSFDAYTSGIGQREAATRHMTFRGRRTERQTADAAANLVGFPSNEVAFDLSNGFEEAYLTPVPGPANLLSATFLAQQATNDVYALALASGDPIRIDQHPYLSSLQVDLTLNDSIQGKTLFLYLSRESLTDQNGWMLEEPFETVQHFPELSQGEDEFLFTYLHPGDYYLTVVADLNADGFPSEGDMTNISLLVNIPQETAAQVTVSDIVHQN